MTLEEYQISEPNMDNLVTQADDETLEKQTRGYDAKGNMRYFCPKCHVRYIGT